MAYFGLAYKGGIVVAEYSHSSGKFEILSDMPVAQIQQPAEHTTGGKDTLSAVLIFLYLLALSALGVLATDLT